MILCAVTLSLHLLCSQFAPRTVDLRTILNPRIGLGSLNPVLNGKAVISLAGRSPSGAPLSKRHHSGWDIMMSATPPRHVPELPTLPATSSLPLPPPALEQDKKFKESVIGEADDRSSSLSEIEERGMIEHLDIAPSINGSDGGDTEAETERLEDSPHKVRSQQNVVLTATVVPHGNSETQSNDAVEVPIVQDQGMTFAIGNVERMLILSDNMENEKIPQTSDISSLDDFSDVEAISPTSNTLKRKRPLYTPSPQPSLVIPTKRLESILGEEKLETREQSRLGSPEIYGDEVPAEDVQDYQRNDDELSGIGASTASPRKKFKGNQNGKKIEVVSVQDAADLATEIGNIMAPHPTIETSYKNSVGVEDPADGAEIETSVKSEEGRKFNDAPLYMVQQYLDTQNQY